tara:strand:- start:757 stop:1590 length:834 start_codon:yes stop_codon:yes gene_type:complete
MNINLNKFKNYKELKELKYYKNLSDKYKTKLNNKKNNQTGGINFTNLFKNEQSISYKDKLNFFINNLKFILDDKESEYYLDYCKDKLNKEKKTDIEQQELNLIYNKVDDLCLQKKNLFKNNKLHEWIHSTENINKYNITTDNRYIEKLKEIEKLCDEYIKKDYNNYLYKEILDFNNKNNFTNLDKYSKEYSTNKRKQRYKELIKEFDTINYQRDGFLEYHKLNKYPDDMQQFESTIQNHYIEPYSFNYEVEKKVKKKYEEFIDTFKIYYDKLSINYN